MTKDDLNSLAWPAMRYALGRKTYVVDTVCRALINNVNGIRSDIRASMIREIEKAIHFGDAGMDMDLERWKDVVIAFKKNQQSN